MTTRTLQRSLVLVALAAGVSTVGCELIVDFDRSQIPVELPDEGRPDTGPRDDGAVVPTPDASEEDAGDAGEPDADAPPQIVDAAPDADADADAANDDDEQP